MRTYSLYLGYDSDEAIATTQAESHVQAANYFREYLKKELNKDSLYGYTIKRNDFDTYDKYIDSVYDLYIHKNDIPNMLQGREGKGYIHVEDKSNYELISKHAFQPLIRINANTFSVVFINE